jgi:putative sterol carrier protein
MSVEAPPHGSCASSAGTHFEDFSVGQRLTTGPRPVPESSCRGGGGPRPGPLPLVTFLGLVTDSGALPASLLRVVDVHWRDVAPVPAGESVDAAFTVTRCHRIPTEAAGSVRWHAQVTDQQGRTVQEGTITALVPARSDSDGSGDPMRHAFCTKPWGEALSRRLADCPDFTAATATWDGSIGLRSGGDQVQLRIYRGRVIEVAPRTPLGATFTLEAAEHVWTDLMTGESNDFFRRAMSGGSFTVTGNVHEYLRMSKALMALIDTARELAAGAHL